MNAKILTLLKLLLNGKYSILELAEEFGTTERFIRYIIDDCDFYLRSINLPPISFSEDGIYLTLNDEQRERLAQLEAVVADRAKSNTCTEEDIEAYKIAMAEYNLAQAYAKRDGVECTMAKPRNPQRSTGTFIDLLTEEEYSEYQAIIEACEEAKKNAPKASRKLTDDEKIARKEKAIAEKKAAFLAKYGRSI